MEEALRVKKRVQQTGWKNKVEEDLKRLLAKKGVIGAFLISKNGETITQAFQETLKHKESTLMQFVKKVVPMMITLRNVPLCRTIFETDEGCAIFFNIENGMIGCVHEKGSDLLSIMLEIRTVGEFIDHHLNNMELSMDERDRILAENREEFRMLNSGLLKEIENHFGLKTAEQLIQRTVR
jgi:hypothetical protein